MSAKKETLPVVLHVSTLEDFFKSREAYCSLEIDILPQARALSENYGGYLFLTDLSRLLGEDLLKRLTQFIVWQRANSQPFVDITTSQLPQPDQDDIQRLLRERYKKKEKGAAK